MTDYTPTTEEVRDAYVVGMEHDCYYEGDVKLTPDGVYEANRFNAWLAEYTRVKQAEALVMIARELEEIEMNMDAGFGYKCRINADWLRARAAEYRKGEER